MRGGFTESEYEREIGLVRETIGALDEPHWREYLAAWPASPMQPAAAPAVSVEAPLAADESVAAVVEISTSIYIEASSIRP
jgi:hypothetical protein